MSTTSSIPLVAKRGFYERTILDLLNQMQRGRMQITLPDGELVLIGAGDTNLSASITIKNPDFFKRCVLFGDIGFGEAYVDGLWETDNIGNVMRWFLLNVDNAPTVSGSKVRSFGLNLLKMINKLTHTKNKNSVIGSRKNISAHYDLDNNFFSLFLDPTMTYSAAYFNRDGISLQEAQEEKYDRLCRQLELKDSDRVLEIGTGWGGNAIFMAKRYGCQVTTTTISCEQYKFAKQRVEEEGLSDKVTVLLQDYRTLTGVYDKIVSIEMLEAVGHKFLGTYFEKCNDLLKANGIFALQTITCPDSRYDELRKGVDWIQKHIFPGSLLPSVAAINKAVNQVSELTLVDLKDMGLHYAATLAAWREQFNSKVASIRELGFDETFIRKWNYYFSYCEAAFTMRNINVMQMVYVRPNTIAR